MALAPPVIPYANHGATENTEDPQKSSLGLMLVGGVGPKTSLRAFSVVSVTPVVGVRGQTRSAIRHNPSALSA
jgi:hypothetical protein